MLSPRSKKLPWSGCQFPRIDRHAAVSCATGWAEKGTEVAARSFKKVMRTSRNKRTQRVCQRYFSPRGDSRAAAGARRRSGCAIRRKQTPAGDHYLPQHDLFKLRQPGSTNHEFREKTSLNGGGSRNRDGSGQVATRPGWRGSQVCRLAKVQAPDHEPPGDDVSRQQEECPESDPGVPPAEPGA